MRWVTDLFELSFALPWVGQFSRNKLSLRRLREFALAAVPPAVPGQHPPSFLRNYGGYDRGAKR
ncbi:hypothetical protein HY346_02175 [Candidatus Microgenomates bacterium]|nr:hypothetical protein [Candidatus Microgenomates bacterium]